MRALLTVARKDGIVDFASALIALGWEIISTGGTAAALRSAQLPVTEVATVTSYAEMLDGRVKTLHPAIHGAILARRGDNVHTRQLQEHGIVPIDMVVCNLYDFSGTVANPLLTTTDAIEHIDIGGVALLRAAAKNYDAVTAIHDSNEYATVLAEIQSHGMTLVDTRRRLAASVFAHTAVYDGQIAMYLANLDGNQFPAELALPLERISTLRYGENPHQQAAFYRWQSPNPVVGATIASAQPLHGKQLSFNNLVDLDAALGIVSDFATPAVAIVKHAGPCGVATGPLLVDVFRAALAGDPVSAFGGIIGLNRSVDIATATAISESHYDAVIAPDFAPEALALLERRKNLILVATKVAIEPNNAPPSFATLDVRRLSGGILLQTPNQVADANFQPQVATTRTPTADEMSALLFAWTIVKHVKSNAIVLAQGQQTVGLCGGQPNRVDAIRIAAIRAGDTSKGSALASDAFLPFADNITEAVAAGVTAIIQPGGSVRDAEVIAAANEHGIAMIFTNYRNFRH